MVGWGWKGGNGRVRIVRMVGWEWKGGNGRVRIVRMVRWGWKGGDGGEASQFLVAFRLLSCGAGAQPHQAKEVLLRIYPCKAL